MRTALRNPNSLIIRENTGNFRDFDHLGSCLKPKKPCLLSRFSLNSLLVGSGNSKTRPGNYFDGTRNFFRITGTPVSGSFEEKEGASRLARPANYAVWNAYFHSNSSLFVLPSASVSYSNAALTIGNAPASPGRAAHYHLNRIEIGRLCAIGLVVAYVWINSAARPLQ
jgi:hypothetical protein